MPAKKGSANKATDSDKRGSAASFLSDFKWEYGDFPKNIDAESGVLACILLDESKEVMNMCVERRVDEGYFFDEHNRAIFGAMRALDAEGKPIDMVMLSEKLKERGLFSSEIADHIAAILGRVETIANFTHWIDVLREKYFLRKISCECVKTLVKVKQSDGGIDELLGDVEEAFLGINSDRVGDAIRSAQEQMPDVAQKIKTIIDNKGALMGIPTGFSGLDQKLYGLHPNEMIIIAGRPGTGKTSIALNIVENAVFGGKPVNTLIFSLEMLADDLYLRMVSSRSRADQHLFKAGRLPKEKVEDMYNAVKEIQGAPIWIDDTAGVRISEMRAKARRLNQKLKGKLGLIVVDYLQLVRSSAASIPSREQEIAEVSRGLKAMAKELLVPVIVLAQLNRESEKDERVPRASDLRESGSIEQDADAILLLSHQRTNKEVAEDGNWIIRAELAKNRNGPTGVIKLLFNRSYTRYENYLETDAEII